MIFRPAMITGTARDAPVTSAGSDPAPVQVSVQKPLKSALKKGTGRRKLQVVINEAKNTYCEVGHLELADVPQLVSVREIDLTLPELLTCDPPQAFVDSVTLSPPEEYKDTGGRCEETVLEDSSEGSDTSSDGSESPVEPAPLADDSATVGDHVNIQKRPRDSDISAPNAPESDDASATTSKTDVVSSRRNLPDLVTGSGAGAVEPGEREFTLSDGVACAKDTPESEGTTPLTVANLQRHDATTESAGEATSAAPKGGGILKGGKLWSGRGPDRGGMDSDESDSNQQRRSVRFGLAAERPQCVSDGAVAPPALAKLGTSISTENNSSVSSVETVILAEPRLPANATKRPPDNFRCSTEPAGGASECSDFSKSSSDSVSSESTLTESRIRRLENSDLAQAAGCVQSNWDVRRALEQSAARRKRLDMNQVKRRSDLRTPAVDRLEKDGRIQDSLRRLTALSVEEAEDSSDQELFGDERSGTRDDNLPSKDSGMNTQSKLEPNAEASEDVIVQLKDKCPVPPRSVHFDPSCRYDSIDSDIPPPPPPPQSANLRLATFATTFALSDRRAAEPRRQFLSTLAVSSSSALQFIKDKLSRRPAGDRDSVTSSSAGSRDSYTLDDIDDVLKSDDSQGSLTTPQPDGRQASSVDSGFVSHDGQAPPAEAAGSVEEVDELAVFAEQHAARTERLRRRYSISCEEEPDEGGFVRRPSVRGIRPRYGSTSELLQQMRAEFLAPAARRLQAVSEERPAVFGSTGELCLEQRRRQPPWFGSTQQLDRQRRPASALAHRAGLYPQGTPAWTLPGRPAPQYGSPPTLRRSAGPSTLPQLAHLSQQLTVHQSAPDLSQLPEAPKVVSTAVLPAATRQRSQQPPADQQQLQQLQAQQPRHRSKQQGRPGGQLPQLSHAYLPPQLVYSQQQRQQQQQRRRQLQQGVPQPQQLISLQQQKQQLQLRNHTQQPTLQTWQPVSVQQLQQNQLQQQHWLQLQQQKLQARQQQQRHPSLLPPPAAGQANYHLPRPPPGARLRFGSTNDIYSPTATELETFTHDV